MNEIEPTQTLENSIKQNYLNVYKDSENILTNVSLVLRQIDVYFQRCKNESETSKKFEEIRTELTIFLENKFLKTKQNEPHGNPKLGHSSELESRLKTETLITNNLVTFNEVIGNDEAKKTFRESVIFPSKFPNFFVGLRSPWLSILLYGPPGTGKTLLAKAAAYEGQRKLIFVSSSTIASKFVGESERLVKHIFDIAIENSPSLILWDEIDCVMSARGGKVESECSKNVKNEMLIQLDRLKDVVKMEKKSITFVCTTNLPWVLDSAFMRRVEKKNYVPLPNEEEILDLLKKTLEDNVTIDFDLNIIAPKLLGYSNSDITHLCRDAAMMQFQNYVNSNCQFNESPVTLNDFQIAIGKRQKTVPQSMIDNFRKWKEMN